MLSKRCAAVIGVDLTPQVVHLARQRCDVCWTERRPSAPFLALGHPCAAPPLCRYPSVRFEVLDGADVEGALRLASEAGHPAAFSKVLVDISGQVRGFLQANSRACASGKVTP